MASNSAIALGFPDFTATSMGELLKNLTRDRHHPDTALSVKQQAEKVGVPAFILAPLFHMMANRTPVFAASKSHSKAMWVQDIRAKGCELRAPVAPYYFVAGRAVLSQDGVVVGSSLGVSIPGPEASTWPTLYKEKAAAEGAFYCESRDDLVQHLAGAIAQEANRILANMRKAAGLATHTWGEGSQYKAPFPVARNRYQVPVEGRAATTFMPSNYLLVDTMAEVQQVIEDFLSQVEGSGSSSSKSATLKAFPTTKSVVTNPESQPELLPLAQWAFGKGGPLLQDEAASVLPRLEAVNVPQCTNPELAGKVLGLLKELANSVRYGSKENVLMLWAR